MFTALTLDPFAFDPTLGARMFGFHRRRSPCGGVPYGVLARGSDERACAIVWELAAAGGDGCCVGEGRVHIDNQGCVRELGMC